MKHLARLACLVPVLIQSCATTNPSASHGTTRLLPSYAATQDPVAPDESPASEQLDDVTDVGDSSAALETTAAAESTAPDNGPSVDQPLAPEGTNASDDTVVEAESPWEKWSVSLGGMLVTTNSGARFGAAGVGIDVNLEELLGLDSSTSSYRFEGAWRFSDNLRHRVGVSWLDLSRSGSLATQQDVDVGGGTVIPAGTGVKAGFQMNLIRTDYSYSFVQDERVDLAAVFGLYVAPIDVSVETTTGSGYQNSFDVTAPLPLIGLRMDFLVAPKWYLRSNVSLFYLEYDGYKGGMSDIMLGAEYRAWKHFAIGLGVDTFRFAVESNGSTSVPGVDRQGSVDYGYTGLMLYLKGLW